MKTYKTGGGWGDAITVFSSDKLAVDGTMRVYGFKQRHPRKKDLLHVPMQSGKTAIFEFKKIEPQRDPSDMFFADVEYTGKYVEDEDNKQNTGGVL